MAATGEHPWRAAATLAGLILLAALCTLSVPVLGVAINAYAARSASESALEAVKDQDLDSAIEHVAEAREQAADLRRAAHGYSGWVLGLMPQGEVAKRDVEHIGDAVTDVVSMLDVVVQAYPQVVGPDATVIDSDGRIDMSELRRILDEVPVLRRHADLAESHLSRVRATSPVTSWFISSTRDAVDERLSPIAEGLRVLEPAVPFIPEALGEDLPKAYLIALLNPSEQRFSGGAPLSFTTLVMMDGKLMRGTPLTVRSDPKAFRPFSWEGVQGNPFHPPDTDLRLTTATFAPSWSVSGEELARAWREVRGTYIAGVIAIDVAALQKFMRITGPIGVPGFGVLTPENLTRKLVGSYDELTSLDVLQERRLGSEVLLKSFQAKFLNARNLGAKASTIHEAAQSRHLAIYLRRDEMQAAIGGLGLAGDLSSSAHDYIGVFNQALSGQKSDYWQRRDISSDVTLHADGSADVRLEITVHNDSPPPARDVDPLFVNYVQRTNHMALGVFLPKGVGSVSASVNDRADQPAVHDFFGRPYVISRLTIDPEEEATFVYEYSVPRAAVIKGRRLVYRLAVDPAGLVKPQQLRVQVRWPSGYAATALPAGWESAQGRARYRDDEWAGSNQWTLTGTVEDHPVSAGGQPVDVKGGMS